jgi:glycosyltransferase involved in cell wall biosynthesis
MGDPGRLHVLMTADAAGGVWTYVVSLVQGLAARHVRCTVALLGPPPDAAALHELQRTPGTEIVRRPFALEWMPEAERDFDAAAAWVQALARERRPDLVQVNGYALAACAFGCPAIVVAHSCVRSWWRAVHGCEAPSPWQAYRERVEAGLRAARAVVAPTAAMLEALREEYRWRGGGLVVHNGLPPAAAAGAGPRCGVLGAGRVWDAAKNLAALDDAAAAIAAPVRIAGDATAPGGVTRVPRHATYLGRLSREDLLAQMRGAAVYALPARYEPFGLSVLEAAQCGCALVLGDIPTLRELWDGAAVFVHPDDRAGLAYAIDGLLADEPARRALVAAAMARAADYTHTAMADAYLALYRALARPAEAMSCAS